MSGENLCVRSPFSPLLFSSRVAGHGVTTRRESSAASEKLNGMKSAMEWQAAKQQLLAGDP